MSLQNFIWYERNRPTTLEEMILPPQYRRSLTEYITKGEVPHLLLHGPRGSGKTTIAFIIMNSIPCVTLKLNASMDRSIELMRGKVKQFASSSTIDGKLKIVFMDEFDGVLRDSQEALRGTIETYSKTCRFIFTCNDIDRVIDKIQSRCTMFEFTAFPILQVITQCESILKKEKITYEISDVEKIVKQFYPDIRSVINNLQLCSSGGSLDPEIASRVAIDPSLLLDLIAGGEVGKIRSMLIGVSIFVSLYQYLFDTLLDLEDLTQEEKVSIVGILSEHLYRDSTVANREINFVACCISLMGELKVDSLTF